MFVPGSVSVRMVSPSMKVASAVAPAPVLATVTLQNQLAAAFVSRVVAFDVFPVMLLILLAVRSGHWMKMSAMTVVFALVLVRSTLSTLAVALPFPQAPAIKVAVAVPLLWIDSGCALGMVPLITVSNVIGRPSRTSMLARAIELRVVPSYSCKKSAVSVLLPFRRMLVGLAVWVSTIHGESVRVAPDPPTMAAV